MNPKDVRKDLSPRAKIIFNLLLSRKGPVSVPCLFRAVNTTPGIYDNRQQQQRLGGPVTELNRRLRQDGYVVVPGEPRGTYRLRKVMTE